MQQEFKRQVKFPGDIFESIFVILGIICLPILLLFTCGGIFWALLNLALLSTSPENASIDGIWGGAATALLTCIPALIISIAIFSSWRDAKKHKPANLTPDKLHTDIFEIVKKEIKVFGGKYSGLVKYKAFQDSSRVKYQIFDPHGKVYLVNKEMYTNLAVGSKVQVTFIKNNYVVDLKVIEDSVNPLPTQAEFQNELDRKLQEAQLSRIVTVFVLIFILMGIFVGCTIFGLFVQIFISK